MWSNSLSFSLLFLHKKYWNRINCRNTRMVLMCIAAIIKSTDILINSYHNTILYVGKMFITTQLKCYGGNAHHKLVIILYLLSWAYLFHRFYCLEATMPYKRWFNILRFRNKAKNRLFRSRKNRLWKKARPWNMAGKQLI